MFAKPNCSKRKCIHFVGVFQPDGTEMSERVVCEAYLDGIPDNIAYGKIKHLKVRPDQNNRIVFESDLTQE